MMSEASEHREEVDQLIDGAEKAVVRSVKDEDAIKESIERLAGIGDKIGALKGLLATVVDAADELKEAIANEVQESQETSGRIIGTAHEAEELLKLANHALDGTKNEHATAAHDNLAAAQGDSSEAAHGYEQGHQAAEWLLNLADGLRQNFDEAGGIIALVEERRGETLEHYDAAKTSKENGVIGNQTAMQELQEYLEGL